MTLKKLLEERVTVLLELDDEIYYTRELGESALVLRVFFL